MDNDFEKRLRNSKNNINESLKNNPQYIYEYCKKGSYKEKKRKLKWNLVVKYSMAVLMVTFLMIIVFNTTTVDTENNYNRYNSYIKENRYKLYYNMKSYNEVNQLFYNYNEENVNNIIFDLEENNKNMPSNDNNTIETADIVKRKGDYLYYIPKTSNIENKVEEKLYVLNIKEQVEIVKVFNYKHAKDIEMNKDLYVTDKYLILHTIIKNSSNAKYGKSKFTIFDINSYNIVKELLVPSAEATVNVNGNDVYIIAKYDNFTESFECPSYYIDGKEVAKDVKDILWCNGLGMDASFYLMIFKISVLDDIKIEDYVYLLSNINNIYMTNNYIYLFKNVLSQTKTNNNVLQTINTDCVIIDINNSMLPKDLITISGKCDNFSNIYEINNYLYIASVSTYNIGTIVNNKFINDTTEYSSYLTIYGSLSENDPAIVKVSQTEINANIESVIFEKEKALVITDKDIRMYQLVGSKFKCKEKEAINFKEGSFKKVYKDKYIIEVDVKNINNSSNYFDFITVYDINNFKIKEFDESINYKSNIFTKFGSIKPERSFMIDVKNDVFGFDTIGQISLNGNIEYFSNYVIFKLDIENDKIELLKEITISNNDLSVQEHSQLEKTITIDDKYYLFGLNQIRVYSLKDKKLSIVQTINISE